MSRTVAAVLLLIVLIHLYNSSASAAPADIREKKTHIRKCRCQPRPNGKFKCRSPIIPRDDKQRKEMIRCICTNFPESCKTWKHGFLISLV